MKVHFLGIGGSGASAVAAIARAFGYEISGCDKEPFNEFTTKFSKEILVQGHSPGHLARHPKGVRTDLLVITPAILSLDPNNPELEEAKKLDIPILTWQEFLGKYLLKDKFVIAVAGTHGKTTTTAMIAQILEDAGLDPTVELGALNPKWGSNFRVGKSKYFIVEADEFNNNFLNYHPDIAVVTNIEFDHPEFFKDFEEYKKSFKNFIGQTKLKIVANLSDPSIKTVILNEVKDISPDLDSSPSAQNDRILDFSKHPINFPLKVPGEFNRLNAYAAFQVALALNIDPNIVRSSLMNYSGIGRRFELIEEYKGAKIFSDFAHHPTEVKKTIEAARIRFPKQRLWVIFQPHMFSRTKVLFDDFVKVFQSLPADQISILDIYPSREVDTGLVNSKQLVEAIKKTNVSYLGPKKDVLNFLKLAIRKDTIVFFVGAGDIDKIARALVSSI